MEMSSHFHFARTYFTLLMGSDYRHSLYHRLRSFAQQEEPWRWHFLQIDFAVFVGSVSGGFELVDGQWQFRIPPIR